ncbi:GAF and ANTAR domain-containing protein [Paenarthrobacter nitroguajacolicus]|uniref:GAF and ANTAR domain-containing protein n=1 Tax=Paenarthrobacter nitroguajacolicus TaxID=211146 RepID=A0A558GRM2_PAENT|nr:GAF and ANTAR domain-containing protein [Paenarthrobacter nitroguajacolicus]TVU59521.1 GAF and ANTAR domain-containing protein [Paenarthrobacter nitroguajacolicus]
MTDTQPSQHIGSPPNGLRQYYEGVDLTDFVVHLQDLLVENADIREFLQDLADMTAMKLTTEGNTIACGVTVIRQKQPVAVADSDAFARTLDKVQNSFGDGPCLTALRTSLVVHVPDVVNERRWPRYMQAAAATRVGSILALPMRLGGTGDAVVNLYSTRPNGFFQENIAVAERLTATGSKALHLALKIAQLQDARQHLTAALESRATINTAVGIIMAQNRCSQDTAFQVLVKASNHRNVKLRAVAAAVIAGVSGDQEFRTAFED